MKLVLAFLLLVTPAFAQLDSGTIVGYVRDQSGAAVQSATVLITSQATNAQWTVTSDDHGDYVSPPLRAGMYSVRVEAPGFKSATKENITIQVQDRLRIDFDMTIGAVSENVEVSADSQVIQTETSSLGQVISSKQITDLPLNGPRLCATGNSYYRRGAHQFRHQWKYRWLQHRRAEQLRGQRRPRNLE